MGNEPLPISVCICTLNEEQDIEACLASVWRNRVAEVVVVDGGSTDRTCELARKTGATVVNSAISGLSSQRQTSIEFASQPYIAIVDGDDHLADDCLPTLLSQLQEYGYDAIQAREVAHVPTTYWERAMGSTNYGITFTERPTDTNMVGRPSLYRAEALCHCGFDAFFDGVGDEDTDLSIRMEMAGFRQGVGTGLTERRQTPDFKGVMRKFIKYGKGDARIIYKYPHKRGRLLWHLAVRYPLVRGFQAFRRGDGRYWPFYALYGWVRLGALLPELIRLCLSRPAHGGYPAHYVDPSSAPAAAADPESKGGGC